MSEQLDWRGCHAANVLAFRKVQRKGWDHLAVVLREQPNGEYVTHIYNAWQQGFAHGHYFNPKWEKGAREAAFKDFELRCAKYGE